MDGTDITTWLGDNLPQTILLIGGLLAVLIAVTYVKDKDSWKYKGLMFLGRKYGYLVGITPNDFKLLTGILVIISLTVAKTRTMASDKGARKKAIERTMKKEEGSNA